MFACICHAVGEDEVVTAVSGGARTIEDVGELTGAGTGCGTCHDRLDTLIERVCATCPLASLQVA